LWKNEKISLCSNLKEAKKREKREIIRMPENESRKKVQKVILCGHAGHGVKAPI
jgi:hypothetical protein